MRGIYQLVSVTFHMQGLQISISFKPKTIVMSMKRGTHCNNDCDMLTNPADIELSCEVASSSSTRRIGSLNPNLIPTKEHEANTFFIKHNPCILSLLSPYCDSYIPNESKETTPLVCTSQKMKN